VRRRAIQALAALAAPAHPTGCPRHPGGDRSCPDIRCLWTWEVPGAPTPDEQLQRWAAGDAVCPNTRHECCPDFACCKPQLAWPPEKRARFVAADPGTREKMMMGSLGGLVAEATDEKVHITRGEPTDHE
jgi:hypothetical protein